MATAQKEFKSVRKGATSVLDEQREVLRHAAAVLADAGSSIADYTRDEFVPSAKASYDANLRPGIQAGLSSAKGAASTARDRVQKDVVPAVAGAYATTRAALDPEKVAKQASTTAKKASKKRDELVKQAEGTRKDLHKRADKAIASAKRSASSSAKELSKKLPQQKKSSGVGRVVAFTLIGLAVAGIAYAAWQTFRADDDLWIEDEPEPLEDIETTEAQAADRPASTD